VAALLGLQCRPSSNVLPLLAGLMFAGAVLARLYPILLGPVCVAWLAMGERPGKRLALFVTAAAAAVSLAYWPFLGAGLGRLTEGLRTYGAHWLRNAGAFLLLGKLPGDPRRTVAVATVLYAVAEGVVLFWRSRKAGDRPAHDPAALVGALQRVLLCWLLLTPAVFPWYTVALIALLALRPTFWGVVMSGALGAYYLLFLYDYRDYPSEDAWKLWTQGLEHGLIWVAVVVGTVYGAMKARRERCVDA